MMGQLGCEGRICPSCIDRAGLTSICAQVQMYVSGSASRGFLSARSGLVTIVFHVTFSGQESGSGEGGVEVYGKKRAD